MISALSSELPKGSTGKVALPPPPQAPFCILHSEFWAELLPKRAAICNLHPAFCVLSVSQRFKALERGREREYSSHSPFSILHNAASAAATARAESVQREGVETLAWTQATSGATRRARQLLGSLARSLATPHAIEQVSSRTDCTYASCLPRGDAAS